MKRTNKLLMSSLLSIAMLFLLTLPVFAAEDAIPSIEVDVLLQSDGSAVITEVWDVRGISDGTEYYKALDNMDAVSVHSLSVWDETDTPFNTLDSWDTDRSREQKAGTCGILETKDGYELCWGIGDYGDHRYTIQYTLDGLVKQYGDYAGFYHQFTGDLSSAPEAVSVKIHVADTMLTEQNARIWAYGFTGEVEMRRDGTLAAFTLDAFGNSDYVNILCRFDSDLFPAAARADKTFDELQEMADSKNSDTLLYLVLGAFAAVIAAFIVVGVYFHSRFKLDDGTTVKLPGEKQIKANWSIPLAGSIPAVYSAMLLLRRAISSEKLMGAYLIRWQEKGYIRIEEQESERSKGKTPKEDTIVFSKDSGVLFGAEQTLYNILSKNIDQDGILRSSAIEERAEELYSALAKWTEQVKAEGEQELMQARIVGKDAKNHLRLTHTGFQRTVSLLGFRKYLLEMQKTGGERGATTELWGDYLVFATMFGIGEKVLKSMEAADPSYYSVFCGAYGCSPYNMIYFMNMTNHITSAAVPNNTDGTGGGASASGGGGFSGGGGGGSR